MRGATSGAEPARAGAGGRPGDGIGDGDGASDEGVDGDELTARGVTGTFGGAMGWSLAMNAGRQAATLLVTFLLARFLGPNAFGIIALATVYIAFVEMLLAQGMVPAIIHHRRLTAEHLDTCFWLVLASACILGALSVAGAGAWAAANDVDGLRPVIWALTPLLPLRALIVVQEALMRRSLDFKPLALRTNVAVLGGGVTGVALAFAGAGVWALVGQQLTTYLLDVGILWGASSWRPRWRFSKDRARELLSYSVPAAAASVGVFVNRRADALVLGSFVGAATLGLYRFAMRLVETLVESAVGSLGAAGLPELARHQHDRARFSDRIVSMVRLTAYSATVLLCGLAAAARPGLAVLGDRWLPAADGLRVLCIAGVLASLAALGGPALQALGRTRTLAALSWTASALSVSTFAVVGSTLDGRPFDAQVTTLASATAILYGVLAALYLTIVGRSVGLRLRRLAELTAVALVGGSTGFALGHVGAMAVAGWAPDLVVATAAASTASLTALGVLVGIDPEYRSLLVRAGSRLVPSGAAR